MSNLSDGELIYLLRCAATARLQDADIRLLEELIRRYHRRSWRRAALALVKDDPCTTSN